MPDALNASAMPDALILGTGCAGLCTALRLLDAGAHVVLMDKERRAGGNSVKASSGINAYETMAAPAESSAHDSVEAFAQDTAKSARRNPEGLIDILTESSGMAIAWLRERAAVDLSQVSQLGGHSFARTHRPASGPVGAELTYCLLREVRRGRRRTLAAFQPHLPSPICSAHYVRVDKDVEGETHTPRPSPRSRTPKSLWRCQSQSRRSSALFFPFFKS
jgi:aspartate oxidase